MLDPDAKVTYMGIDLSSGADVTAEVGWKTVIGERRLDHLGVNFVEQHIAFVRFLDQLPSPSKPVRKSWRRRLQARTRDARAYLRHVRDAVLGRTCEYNYEGDW